MKFPALLLPVMLAAAVPAAQATPPLTEPGSLVYSCAGHGNGHAYQGIDQETSFYPGEYQCRERFDPLGGKVSAKAAYAGPNGGSAGSKGQARWGSIKVQDDSNTVTGEAGRTISGYTDGWTVSSPSQIGQYGYVTVRWKVVGHIEAHGSSGSARMVAAIYKNGGSAAQKAWAVETDIWTPDASLDINEVAEVTFQVNFNTPFMLSTLVTAQSGARSLDGIGHGLTRATQPGLVWRGIVKVTDRFNQPLSDWSLTSTSGIDWRQPCPCSAP